jgi:chorismate mutase
MAEACDPDADIENLRKSIKMQTGENVKLTRKQMCEAYDNIHGGKLPLPPLVMTADRTYLIDRASPLKHLEYELLFDSATKRVDLKKIARKVGLTSQIEQMTKKQLTDAIGKRLRYLKIREPVKIVSKRLITKDVSNTAVNNTAVRNNTAVNNTAVNNNRRNFNNNSAFNNTENRSSNFNNFGGNKNRNGNANFGNGNRNGNANFGNGNRNGNANFGNGNRNGNRVNLSGNKKGFTMTNNSGKGQNTLQFPSKLSFKSSFISKNSGNQPVTQSFPNRVPASKPAFLSQPQNAGPSAPTPAFSGGVKKNASFLNKGTNAPAFSGGVKKNASFMSKGTNAPTNVKKNASFLTKGTNAPSGPKRGMFNFFKRGATTGAAAGATAGAVAATANETKKCGMFNRMMGRCKKNDGNKNQANTGTGTNNANRANAGTDTNNANRANAGTGTNNANRANAGTGTNNANRANAGVGTNNVNRANAGTGTNNVNRANAGTGTNNVNRANAGTGTNNVNRANAGTGTNNVNRANAGTGTNNVNRDVNYVANKILTEINKDVKNERLVSTVADNIVDEMLKKDITNRINGRNLVAVSNKENLNGLNNTTRKMIVSINNATTLKELRKIYLKGALKLHPNKGGNKDTFQVFMRAHNKKQELLKSGNVNYVANKIMKEINTDVIKQVNNGSNKKQKLLKSGNVNYVANKIMKEINKDVIKQVSNGFKNNKILAIANKPVNSTKFNKQMTLEPSQVDIEYVANQILNKLQNEVQNEISKKSNVNNKVANNKVANNKVANKDVEIVADQILIQLTNDVKTKIRKGGRAAEPVYNSNSNSNSNNNANNKKINNPLFEPNMKNNPVFNLPEEVEAQENNVRNIIKNFNSERNTLQNKITKELNMRPDNNGVFRERKGLTKGRIGVWAQELRKAETVEDLKAIENALNKKVELRKNIENKYTKMGLTNRDEKTRHRNMVVKFKNDVNARRAEIEEYLTKTPTLMNKGSYQSKVNRLQREFPKGTSPNVRRNWMKKSKIYTGRIQKASQYGDMVKAYNNATKSFNNLSKK